MKPGILVTTPIHAPTLAALESEFTVSRLWAAADADAFLAQAGNSVQGAVTNGLVGFSRSLMESLPRLEIIACFGTPRNTIDLAAAQERGVIVTNTPDAIAEPVADLALGLIIAVMRRICEADRYVRSGNWQQGPMAPGTGLGGKICGIVGLGRIGREIATRAQAVGMSVRYHGPHRKEDAPYPYHPEAESLARASDCLVIACPETPATRGMIDRRILDALGPAGFLVNIARGPIVEESALVSALAEKRIAGAGLDVFWNEPRVPPALLALANVVLIPHMGSTTHEVRDERGAKVLANLRAHFAGQPVLHPFG